MRDVEIIIKSYFHNQPEERKLRVKMELISFLSKLCEFQVLADLGISGEIVYKLKSGKIITIRRW